MVAPCGQVVWTTPFVVGTFEMITLLCKPMNSILRSSPWVIVQQAIGWLSAWSRRQWNWSISRRRRALLRAHRRRSRPINTRWICTKVVFWPWSSPIKANGSSQLAKIITFTVVEHRPAFFSFNRKNRPVFSVVTSQPMIDTFSPDLEIRRPLSTKWPIESSLAVVCLSVCTFFQIDVHVHFYFPTRPIHSCQSLCVCVCSNVNNDDGSICPSNTPSRARRLKRSSLSSVDSKRTTVVRFFTDASIAFCKVQYACQTLSVVRLCIDAHWKREGGRN